ncbi:MAG TPA: SRPBCC domain-containing protein [Chitinophagaceae bacterium]|nr:SRPBCC domain-containing protein [Chitinophagaceae bacterium]
MKGQDYTCSIAVSAAPKEAFEAIGEVSKWWATNFQGSALYLNDSFTVRFGKTFGVFEIKELVPNKKITWQVTESYLPLFKNVRQWENTEIAWEITTNNSDTQITMTHIGLTPDIECYTDCEKGWNFYIRESLKKLITEGKGNPGTGIFAHISRDGRRYEGLLYFKNDPLPDHGDGYIVVDVKETIGEEVTKAYSATEYQKRNFDPALMKGEYLAIFEKSSLSTQLPALEDICNIIDNGDD